MIKVSLSLVVIGLAFMFTPIWVGPAELMLVGVAILLTGFLLFNKMQTGTFFPRSYRRSDYYDRFDRDNAGESSGEGSSDDRDDSDTV